MDRNTIIGFVLIVILLIAYSVYNSYQEPVVVEDTQTTTDTIGTTEETEETPAPIEEEVAVTDTTLPDSVRNERLQAIYGPFANAAVGEEQTFVLENEEMRVVFTSKGGQIVAAQVKGYKSFEGDPVILLQEGDNQFSVGLPIYNQFINTSDLYFEGEQRGNSVVFRANAGDAYVEQIYTLPEGSNFLDYDLNLVGLDEMVPQRETRITLNWKSKLHRQERSYDKEQGNTTIYYKQQNEDVDYISEGDDVTEERLDFPLKWVSFKQQFFNATLVADEGFERGVVSTFGPEEEDPGYNQYLKELEAKLYLPYNGDQEVNYGMQYYFGSNGYNQLKKYDLEMEEMVPLGWVIFRWVNKFLILPVFNLLGSFMSNYGVIIFLLALFIKIILTPLTYKSYLSTAKMKVLKPELDEIREKYKDDMQKIQMEQMKLYRKTGVNMMGGCVPMLLQFPILLAMYQFFPASIHLRQESFLWAEDLSTYDDILPYLGIEQLPFSIPFYGDHVSLFTILMAASSILYARLNSQMTPGGGAAAGQMKMLQYIMPVFLLFIFNSFAAGLTYYYLLYNVLSFAQQYFFKAFIIDEDAIRRKIEERKKKPVKPSKWQKRLENIQKAQQQRMREQQKGRGRRK